jgi:RNA polymerase sigma-70 factor (ECF subfamily)
MKTKELVIAAQGGCQKSIAKLYTNFYPKLVGLVRARMLGVKDPQIVEDIAQEAIIKAFGKIVDYKPTYNFSSWISRITLNLMIDSARKMNRIDEVSIQGMIDVSQKGDDEAVELDIVDEEPLPDAGMISEESREEVKELIGALTPELQEVVNLRYFQDMSYVEIEEMLDIPLGTVKNRLFKAHKELRKTLRAVLAA